MIAASSRCYHAMLRLYPAQFRGEYGALMAQCFRDLCLEAVQTGGPSGIIRVWLRVIPDFTRSLIREHFENQWGKRGSVNAYPELIDRFQIKDRLGDGSLCTVFRAYDPDRKADVAIKLLKPGESASGLGRVHLQCEIGVLETLDHPAIPKAYGLFQSDAGTYLVMDFVPGRSLLQVLEQTKDFLAEREIITWGIQVCATLTYLHSRQPQPLLFRDIKPSNFILDENGGFHLVDFGISVPYIPGQVYECIGTEGYAAPEQYQGHEEPRSDLYALGAALHQLATRIDPREEVKRRPFTFAPPRSANPDLSKGFAGVIQKALAYELEDRYSSAAEMQAALEACL